MTRFALVLAALALGAGCAAETSGYSGDVFVYGEAIPPPVPEPKDDAGCWNWSGVGYDWIARCPASPPPHWEVRGRHHIWVRGY